MNDKSTPPPEIIDLMLNLKTEIDTLNKTIQLYEEFSNDYFMTLNESGFNEITDILHALSSIYALSNELIESKRYKETNDILNFLLKNKGVGTCPTVISRFSHLIISWPEKINNRIELLEKNLKNASKQFQAVGTVRRRERNPTSLILGDIRKSILRSMIGRLFPNKKKNIF